MKLAEHVIRYLTKGLELKEITEKRQRPNGYRKFAIEKTGLNYYVHCSGFVVIGKTINTAYTPHSDLLKKIARWELDHSAAGDKK